jgi:hypothetical protein
MREPLEPSDPEAIGRFRLTARLGRGGMGTVYLGEDEDGAPIAIKLINPEYAAVPEFRARFRREVGAARRVRSHSTAPVVEASLDEDPLFVAVEFIDGPDLDSAVAGKGPLRGSSLEQLAVGVATALRAIHEAGLVHRDLKPSNVLLSPTGPRVIDFGISRAMDELTKITAAGQIVGTPAFIAPELIDGRPLTPAADVFSWGGVIAFAGTGRAPFAGRSVHEVLNKVGSHPPDLDGLEPLLRGVVERALSKRPEQRPTVADLLNEFATSTDGAVGAETKSSGTKIFDTGAPVGGRTTSMPTPPPWAATGGQGGAPTRPPAPPRRRRRVPGRRRRVPGLRLLIMLVAGIAPVLLVLWGLTRSPLQFDDIGQRIKSGPSATTGVDAAFVGRWSGTVTEHRPGGSKSTYTAVIDIRAGGRVGKTIGTSRYAKLKCSGELRLESATSTRLRLREFIKTGRGNCINDVLIQLVRKAGALDYAVLGETTPAAGRLKRQD